MPELKKGDSREQLPGLKRAAGQPVPDSDMELGAAKPAAAPAQPAAQPLAKHKVAAGETLSHLALKYYGNASKDYWMAIYEANKGVIGSNPNVIKVGQELVIPEFKK